MIHDAMELAPDSRSTAAEGEGIVSFPEGLVGLPDARRFAFDASEEIAPFLRMRCLDRAELTFLVVDPRLVQPSFRPALGAEALASIGLDPAAPALVLAIARIAPRVEDCSANLLAPLVINPSTLRGVQVVLDPKEHSARHPLAATP